MTWRALLAPRPVLLFVRCFLLGFVPITGFGSLSGESVSALQVVAWPSGPVIMGGIFVGLVNAINCVLTLYMMPPDAGK